MKNATYDESTTDRKDSASSSHPVGTGVGAAGGAVTGAVVGTAVAGPVGAVVGGVIGAAAGAVGGYSVAEATNPTVETAYWRENYNKRDYFDSNRPYSDYGPAYQYGWESRARMGPRKFNEVESDLGKGWNTAKGGSNLPWEQAKQATRDAWHRVERAIPGDADGDGR